MQQDGNQSVGSGASSLRETVAVIGDIFKMAQGMQPQQQQHQDTAAMQPPMQAQPYPHPQPYPQPYPHPQPYPQPQHNPQQQYILVNGRMLPVTAMPAVQAPLSAHPQTPHAQQGGRQACMVCEKQHIGECTRWFFLNSGEPNPAHQHIHQGMSREQFWSSDLATRFRSKTTTPRGSNINHVPRQQQQQHQQYQQQQHPEQTRATIDDGQQQQLAEVQRQLKILQQQQAGVQATTTAPYVDRILHEGQIHDLKMQLKAKEKEKEDFISNYSKQANNIFSPLTARKYGARMEALEKTLRGAKQDKEIEKQQLEEQNKLLKEQLAALQEEKGTKRKHDQTETPQGNTVQDKEEEQEFVKETIAALEALYKTSVDKWREYVFSEMGATFNLATTPTKARVDSVNKKVADKVVAESAV
jgi:hypothetical protein